MDGFSSVVKYLQLRQGGTPDKVGSGLTHEHWAWLEWHAGDKHSSLLKPFRKWRREKKSLVALAAAGGM